ncbi:MAG: hypothetical protein BGO68_06150 [Candidatus Amoebophilus sp. 36-38]|nr:MAG: hypothetical protein BGO68_06150 [Candidatus Amoebophilus sp. 36-38]
MKKILLLINCLLLALGSMVYAKAPAARAKYKGSSNNMEQIKFGPQVGGLGILSDKVGFFGEYALTEKLGMQADLLYFTNTYYIDSIDISNGKSALVQLDYINIPIILRMYPGSDRQFCWLIGTHLGYLIRGKFKFSDENNLDPINNTEKFKNVFQEIGFTNLKDVEEQDKIRKFQFGIVVGFDYEFGFGLILGLTYTKDLIDIIKSEKSFYNWTLQPTLGYNFGKLL